MTKPADPDDALHPFTIAVPQAPLDDLALRLAHVRWPDRETEAGWDQGVPLSEMQALRDHWVGAYDWRRCEAALNARSQFITRIDGIDIHFLHVRSRHAGATPMILTHGWPGSVVEFLKVIDGLVDPAASGGTAADAFHLVIPSIPGYGFSGKPEHGGWDIARIARVWATLMERLGHTGYIAQGGDWGAGISQHLGALAPSGLAAIHLNLPLGFPTPPEMERLTAEESAILARLDDHVRNGRAYSEVQRTKPQTLGYGLADSPIGQAAWIYEKFFLWTDCRDRPTDALTLDEMLDTIMIYWLTNSGASSARLYRESSTDFSAARVEIPVGVSSFRREIMRSTRRWTERLYPRLIYWNEVPEGGHFAAFEQPTAFIGEMRNFRRALAATATAL